MPAARGGSDRISTKTKLARELVVMGTVLAEVRERAGVKQADLAARLNLPASYLSKIEKGTRRLDVVELIRIAEALGVDAGALVNEIRERIVNPQ